MGGGSIETLSTLKWSLLYLLCRGVTGDAEVRDIVAKTVNAAILNVMLPCRNIAFANHWRACRRRKRVIKVAYPNIFTHAIDAGTDELLTTVDLCENGNFVFVVDNIDVFLLPWQYIHKTYPTQ